MIIALRTEIIEILRNKNNEISLQIIDVIDIFSEQELIELKMILIQTDIMKLKEALLYKHGLHKETLDKIIDLQKQFNEIKSVIEQKKKEIKEKKLDDNLDDLLNAI